MRVGIVCDARLDEFEVPVAVVVPEEVVDRVYRIMEPVLIDAVGDGPDGSVEPALDPVVGQFLLGQVGDLGGEFEGALADAEGEQTMRVPNLIREIASHLETAFGEVDVLSVRGEHHQGEADRVGAVLLNHEERVDAVAERLAHFAADLVADGAVYIHVYKRNVTHEFEAGHNHAGDPEEDDFGGGDEELGRVVVFEFGRLLGPAHGAERPEPGGEPRIEHVLVLPDIGG